MTDKPYNKPVTGFADAIKVISFENLDKPIEYTLAAGDGSQIKSQSPDKDAQNDEHLTTCGDGDLDSKANAKSNFSISELEERWKIRLQKLAEFENLSLKERVECSGDNKDEIKEKQQTWHEFWNNVEQESFQKSSE